MRKGSLIFTFLLVFTLLLTACAGGDQEGSETGVPGGEQTGTEVIPETGAGTETATDGAVEGTGTVEPTEGMEGTGTATEEVTEEAPPTAGATEEATEATTPTTGTGGTGGTAGTPEATNQPGGGQGTGTGAGVVGIPETGSGGLVGLAAMMDWRVEGADGTEIGTVQDYVVNMCEAHILYLVVDPAEGVTADGGQQILIPFEAVLGELNEGSSVDVQQGVFTLKQNASDLNGVPGVDIATADLENPDWSEDVLDFWSANYRLSLTAGCSVPVSGNTNGAGTGGTGQQATPDAGTPAAGTPEAGTPAAGTPAAGTPTAGQDVTQPAAGETAVPTAAVTNTVEQTPAAGDRQTIYRVALASEVLTANLQEGNGRVLGTVQDIAIVPETGRTQYVVVEVEGQDASRMVALPPGAVNVSYESGADQPVLVLLVETALLDTAPEFDENNTTTDDNWFNFWNQYIPMTREQLP